MAEALRMLVGGWIHVYAVAFGLLSVGLQVFVPPDLCARALAEGADAVAVDLRGRGVHVARGLVACGQPGGAPQLPGGHEVLLILVAVFGATISPYLLVWQAAQEMEDASGAPTPMLQQVRLHRSWNCTEPR